MQYWQSFVGPQVFLFKLNFIGPPNLPVSESLVKHFMVQEDEPGLEHAHPSAPGWSSLPQLKRALKSWWRSPRTRAWGFYTWENTQWSVPAAGSHHSLVLCLSTSFCLLHLQLSLLPGCYHYYWGNRETDFKTVAWFSAHSNPQSLFVQQMENNISAWDYW